MLFSGIKIDKCVPKEKNKNQSERFITYKKKHVKINLIRGNISILMIADYEGIL